MLRLGALYLMLRFFLANLCYALNIMLRLGHEHVDEHTICDGYCAYGIAWHRPVKESETNEQKTDDSE